MIPVNLNYVIPKNLDSAVKLLAEYKDAQILAGGHSLLTTIKLGYAAPSMIVDLNKIHDLQGIKQCQDSVLQIGAMTTYTQTTAAPEIYKTYHALVEGINYVGDPQIRNWGRIGDIFAYRNLARDLLAAFLAFEATFSIVNSNGIRIIPAEQFIIALAQTGLEEGEIVTAINFPPLNRTGSAYEAFKHPASQYTLCGVASRVEQATDGLIQKCRIAATGLTTPSQRLYHLEAVLEGTAPTTETIAAVSKQAANSMTFAKELSEESSRFISRYASADYCAHLVKVLVERSINRAIKRIKHPD